MQQQYRAAQSTQPSTRPYYLPQPNAQASSLRPAQQIANGAGTIGGSGAGGVGGYGTRRVAESSDFPALSSQSHQSQSSSQSAAQVQQSYAAQAQAQSSQSQSFPPPNLQQQTAAPPPGLQQVNGSTNGMGGLVQGNANGNGSVGDGLRNEDFPALGGVVGDGKDPRLLNPNSKASPSTRTSPSPPTSSLVSHQQPSVSSHPLSSQPLSHPPSSYAASSQGGPQGAGGQIPYDPSQPITKPIQQLLTSPADKWGLQGLLRLIRTGAGRDELLALSLGEDLAGVGLDMGSTAPLYPTFIQPWASPNSLPPVFLEEEFRVPQCYNVNTPPASSKVNMFSDETLFYAFYSAVRDSLQMEVAGELYARQWRYHKELCVWLTKDQGTEPIEKGPNYERGTYIIFDPTVFSRVETSKDFTLSYDMLEDRPVVVSAEGQQQGQQGGVAGQGQR